MNNKIHWTRIQNRVGFETAKKLEALVEFYYSIGVAHFYSKTNTLLEVGKSLNSSNRALFMTCPHFSSPIGIRAGDMILDAQQKVPQFLLDFKNSGLWQLLSSLGIDLRICMSIKEYYEIGRLDLLDQDIKNIYSSLALIQQLFPNASVELMSEEDAFDYQNSLPENHLDLIWPKGFRTFQAKQALKIASRPNEVSIQREVITYPIYQSFYKESFRKTESIITYRTPKKIGC